MTRQTSRRTLLGACAAAATGLLGRAAGQYSFAPEIAYAEDGMSVRVSGDDVASVTLTTADGSTFEYGGDGTWYGYTRAADEPIEGWHGTIEQTEVSDGEETVVRLDPHYRVDLEVGCSTYRTEQDVGDLRLDFEHATKHYDPPTGEGARYGSPGRELREVLEMGNETCVTREAECSPPGSRAVTFDCTSVTVHPEEFVHADAGCYGVELTFADGSTQRVGDATDLPATFAGSGEHEGKVVRSLGFSYDEYGAGWFHYENPGVEGCEPATGGDAEDQADADGADGSDSGEMEGGGGDEPDSSSDAGAEDAEERSADADGTSDEADDGSGDAGGSEDASAASGSSDDAESGEDDGFDWRDLNEEW